jgi:hypothetical protein
MSSAASPARVLTRMLEALERELIEASEEEILEAARALGMNPGMQGSAAFAGLRYFAKPQLSDFFEFEVCRDLQRQIEDSSENPGDAKNSGGEDPS